MRPISWDDFRKMGKRRTSRQALRFRVGDVILCSTAVRATLESVDSRTGEYRVVLQGMLDKESSALTE